MNKQPYYNNKKPQDEYEFGCPFCWDLKRRREKDLFFFDQANNFRQCYYCPNCGRKYLEDQSDTK